MSDVATACRNCLKDTPRRCDSCGQVICRSCRDRHFYLAAQGKARCIGTGKSRRNRGVRYHTIETVDHSD